MQTCGASSTAPGLPRSARSSDAIPLSLALQETWQWAALAGAAVFLFVLRRGVVLTLLVAGAVGAAAVLLCALLRLL